MEGPGVTDVACNSSLSIPCVNTLPNQELPQHVIIILVCGAVFFILIATVICCLKSRGKCKAEGNEPQSRERSRPVCIVRYDGTLIVGGEIVPPSILPPSYSSLNFSDPCVRRVLQRRMSTIGDLPPAYSSHDVKELISDNIDQIAHDINCIIEVTQTKMDADAVRENDIVDPENEENRTHDCGKQVNVGTLVHVNEPCDSCHITIEAERDCDVWRRNSAASTYTPSTNITTRRDDISNIGKIDTQKKTISFSFSGGENADSDEEFV